MTINLPDQPFKNLRSPTWKWLIGLAIVSGIALRLWHIDQKVYWHDEAYSTFRAAGYLKSDIDQAVFQGQPLSAPDLQVFQTLKPDSTFLDTLRSLKVEDPQHAPLYFLMARGWIQAFGSSIFASRLLPVIISLLSLPMMYVLGRELFASSALGWLSVALLALSPVDIVFAQTARQYSLWTFTIIASSWLLLRAMRLNQPRPWLCYGIAAAIGLYSHVFFLLNWAAQGLFTLFQGSRFWLRFGVVSGLSFLLFSPWIVILVSQREQALVTTDWASNRVGASTYLTFWFLSFSALMIDSRGDAIFDWTVMPRTLIILLIMFSFWRVAQTATALQKRFILTLSLVPFLMLVIPDLVLGGSRSTVTRYLIGSYPGIQLAMAYGLGSLAPRDRKLAQVILAALLAGSLTSGLLYARADTWWVKDYSYTNGIVAAYLNSVPDPVVITDRGDLYTNTGDLLSLSYRLNRDVMLLPVPVPMEQDSLEQAIQTTDYSVLLAYRPTKSLQDLLQQAGYQLSNTEVPGVTTITPMANPS